MSHSVNSMRSASYEQGASPRFVWPALDSAELRDRRYEQAVYTAFPVGRLSRARRALGGFNNNEGWAIRVLEGLDSEFPILVPFKLAYIHGYTPESRWEGIPMLPRCQQAIHAAETLVRGTPLFAKKALFMRSFREAVIEFRTTMKAILERRPAATERLHGEADVDLNLDAENPCSTRSSSSSSSI